MDDDNLINMLVEIVKKNEETLCFFIDSFKNDYQKDRGMEGWFQLELIAILLKNKISSKHPGKGHDLNLEDDTKIELRMTTSFNPRYIIDAMIKYNNKNKPFIPVLFFSGYHSYWKNKPNPNFEDADKVKNYFKEEILKNRSKQMNEKLGLTGFSIICKKVDLGEKKGIVGIIKPSKENS